MCALVSAYKLVPASEGLHARIYPFSGVALAIHDPFDARVRIENGRPHAADLGLEGPDRRDVPFDGGERSAAGRPLRRWRDTHRPGERPAPVRAADTRWRGWFSPKRRRRPTRSFPTKRRTSVTAGRVHQARGPVATGPTVLVLFIIFLPQGLLGSVLAGLTRRPAPAR